MVTFDLTTITIPTPAAYNAEEPLQNLENLAYVILQILIKAQTAGVKVSGSGDVAETIESLAVSILAVAGYEE